MSLEMTVSRAAKAAGSQGAYPLTELPFILEALLEASKGRLWVNREGSIECLKRGLPSFHFGAEPAVKLGGVADEAA